MLAHALLLPSPAGRHVPAIVLLVLAAAALAWRRQAPLPVLALTAGAAVVCEVVGVRGAVVLVAVALYTVAVGRRWWWALGAGTAVAVVAAHLSDFAPPILVWTAVVVAAGVAVRATRHASAAILARAEDAALLRLERERLRMAQEVHDVVTHSLAVINVQAGVGAHVAERRPDSARDALVAIKEASAKALDELRASVAALRGPVGAEHSPTPGLARLPELVRAGESAGLTVTVDARPDDLPVPVDAAAFRILREAVTNVVRHAVGASRVDIEVARREAALRLRVRDDGRAATAPVPGTGLRGMADRAAALGGRLTAGPAAGGFVVEATLPLPGHDERPVR